jgi:hypothetical protein
MTEPRLGLLICTVRGPRREVCGHDAARHPARHTWEPAKRPGDDPYADREADRAEIHHAALTGGWVTAVPPVGGAVQYRRPAAGGVECVGVIYTDPPGPIVGWRMLLTPDTCSMQPGVRADAAAWVLTQLRTPPAHRPPPGGDE